MALADDIRELQDRCLSALDASHDYYAHTQAVWRLMQRITKEGRKFSVRNRSTGTSVTEQDLQRLAQHYITDYHMSFTFQHFVTLFESWFFDLLRLWLSAYPHSLAGKKVDFSTVLQASDKTAVTLAVIDKTLNEIKFEKVADWFAFLEELRQARIAGQQRNRAACGDQGIPRYPGPQQWHSKRGVSDEGGETSAIPSGREDGTP